MIISSVAAFLAFFGGVTPAEGAFETILDTGNGTSNTINFVDITDTGDFFWGKSRSAATNHLLMSSVMGVGEFLRPNEANAGTLDATAVTAFNATSTDIGSNTLINANTETFVYWNISTPTNRPSNTDGDITSSTKNNDYFSHGEYQGNGIDSSTVGHGNLNTPEVAVTKNRDGVANWTMYNKDLTAGQNLNLDTNDVAVTHASGDISAVDATTITLKDGGSSGVRVNANLADYFFFTFATVAGKCKVGSYTGNQTVFPSIDAGFTTGTQFLWIKRIDLAGNHAFVDDVRGFAAGSDPILYASLPNLEGSIAVGTSTTAGFDIDSTNAEINAVGGTYIYVAVAVGA